jgi:hypothetical protein
VLVGVDPNHHPLRILGVLLQQRGDLKEAERREPPGADATAVTVVGGS